MHAALILFVLATTVVDNQSRPATPPAAATPIQHTAHFAGQPGWGPDRSTPPPPAAPRYDRYATPPSVIDRGRTAVIETGNALRDGVEAGIQAADRELYRGTEQVIDSARNAGQQAAEQFKGWAGTQAEQITPIASDFLGTTSTSSQPTASQSFPPTTTGRRQVSNPFAPPAPATSSTPSTNSSNTKTRGGVAPPPSWTTSDEPDWENQLPPLDVPRTAALGAPAQRSDGGWSSITPTTPPPTMPVPAMQKAPPLPSNNSGNAISLPFVSSGASSTSSNQQPQQTTTGPGFPATITANPSQDRSLLTNSPPTAPATPQQEALATEDFGISWRGNTQPPQRATITGRYDQDNTAASSATISRSPATPSATVQVQTQQPTSPPAGTPGFDPFDSDFFGDNQKMATVTAQAGQGGVAASAPGNVSQQPAAGATASAGSQSAPPSNANTSPQTTTVATTAPAAQTPDGNDEPWIPLVFASVALSGSVGANLFLGWSYMDARQKYRTLVQKTANKFRRITSAA